jgi:hypothetical protein
MQQKMTVLNGHDRTILGQYADFRLKDQMQSILQNEMESAKANRKEMVSMLSARRQLVEKKSIL